jgi:hypothetical protein
MLEQQIDHFRIVDYAGFCGDFNNDGYDEIFSIFIEGGTGPGYAISFLDIGTMQKGYMLTSQDTKAWQDSFSPFEFVTYQGQDGIRVHNVTRSEGDYNKIIRHHWSFWVWNPEEKKYKQQLETWSYMDDKKDFINLKADPDFFKLKEARKREFYARPYVPKPVDVKKKIESKTSDEVTIDFWDRHMLNKDAVYATIIVLFIFILLITVLLLRSVNRKKKDSLIDK